MRWKETRMLVGFHRLVWLGLAAWWFVVTAICVGIDATETADSAEVDSSTQGAVDSSTQGAVASPTQVVVAYFTPMDRPPAHDHHARIRRIVEEASGFYGRELARHGFGDRKLNVKRDDSGAIEIIDVVGQDADANYGKRDGGRIRNETIPVLQERNVDVDSSVLLLFCNLMDYDPVQSTISHHSPYYGGGNHVSGTAWQCDSEILDPLRLTDPTPLIDGEYGRITIGRHNSIFVGGVIHELGHALSLPHGRERSDEMRWGTALMGSGNRTYREEDRGEGRGTFLTKAHALRLSSLPAFRTRVPADFRNQAQSQCSAIRAVSIQPSVLRIRGIVTSATPVQSVVAYFDPPGNGDYDATTATSAVDSDGRFELTSDLLRTGASAELRLVACHHTGATTQRAFRYSVGVNGTFDLKRMRLQTELAEVVDHLRQSNVVAASRSLNRLAGNDAELAAIGQQVLDEFREATEPLSVNSDSIADTVREIKLSLIQPEFARVGWLAPTYDRVPESARLLSIDGDYFADGIYAHAPSEHRYRLGGQWRRLSGRCGIQADHFGKVRFRVYGDERLIWESSIVTAEASAKLDVDVADVEELRLVVDDGGDGKGGDWAVWISPRLIR